MIRFTFLLLAALTCCGPAFVRADQLVVLDFDTFTDATSDGGDDYFYSPPERTFITALLNEKFAPYPVTFTTVEPSSGLFSKVYFNVGLSDSGDVDFQNTKKIDDASIHVPKLLAIAGLTEPYSPFDVGFATVNVTAHETLHLLGTRHHDSFLPIGGGVPTPFIGSGFEPDFPGPAGATLTGKEFNSLTGSIGFSAPKLLDPTLFVGPRSAVKLLLDTLDTDVDSADANDILDPQMLTFTSIPLPHNAPIPPGAPLPPPTSLLVADVVVVEEGSITELDPPLMGPEGDYYSFFAAAGDVMHIEVLSKILDYRLGDTFDAKVAVLNPATGYSPVAWFGSTAINDDERETTDAMIFDLIMPTTGTFVIEVFSGGAPGADVFGEYEMLVYRIKERPIPEPATLVLALPLVAAAALLRRRHRAISLRHSRAGGNPGGCWTAAIS